jgi:hypothetical protein
MTRWDAINDRLQPLRAALLEHPVYARIGDLDAVRRFMELHVFAVWDFMSLLKALQRRICCVDVPWLPPADPVSARLINEIVLGEETDEIAPGRFDSHFAMYLAAMREAGADTQPMERLIGRLRSGQGLEEALATADIAAPVRAFVGQTFAAIATGDLPTIAAAFTFGREDLLPGIFQQIVGRANREASGRLTTFVRYLDRHIELDSDEHGPLARRLVESLCGNDPANWQRVEQAAVDALSARLKLWDAIGARVDAT